MPDNPVTAAFNAMLAELYQHGKGSGAPLDEQMARRVCMAVDAVLAPRERRLARLERAETERRGE